jgi:hypothetical protein
MLQSLGTTPKHKNSEDSYCHSMRTSQLEPRSVSSHIAMLPHLHNVPCVMTHKLYKCDKFHKLQPSQWFNYVKKQGLCFNCLQPFDKNHVCSSQQCRICHKRHHTLLHIHKQTQATSTNRSINNSPPTSIMGSANTEVNTYHTPKGKYKTHVLLATAIVERTKQANTFLVEHCWTVALSHTS